MRQLLEISGTNVLAIEALPGVILRQLARLIKHRNNSGVRELSVLLL